MIGTKTATRLKKAVLTKRQKNNKKLAKKMLMSMFSLSNNPKVSWEKATAWINEADVSPNRSNVQDSILTNLSTYQELLTLSSGKTINERIKLLENVSNSVDDLKKLPDVLKGDQLLKEVANTLKTQTDIQLNKLIKQKNELVQEDVLPEQHNNIQQQNQDENGLQKANPIIDFIKKRKNGLFLNNENIGLTKGIVPLAIISLHNKGKATFTNENLDFLIAVNEYFRRKENMKVNTMRNKIRNRFKRKENMKVSTMRKNIRNRFLILGAEAQVNLGPGFEDLKNAQFTEDYDNLLVDAYNKIATLLLAQQIANPLIKNLDLNQWQIISKLRSSFEESSLNRSKNETYTQIKTELEAAEALEKLIDKEFNENAKSPETGYVPTKPLTKLLDQLKEQIDTIITLIDSKKADSENSDLSINSSDDKAFAELKTGLQRIKNGIA